MRVILYSGENHMKKEKITLVTPYEKELENGSSPWDIYPRPMMKRDSFISLNGTWDFSKKAADGIKELPPICVPYVPESRLSGTKAKLKNGENWIYTRTFKTPSMKETDHLILHIGAADQMARVLINEKEVLFHKGGYLPFEKDITNELNRLDNTIEVQVFDFHLPEMALGKQSLNRGGMWYTAHSGIWQSVWMEVVPEEHIEKLLVKTTTSSVTVTVIGGQEEKCFLLSGREHPFTGDSFTLTIEDPHLWTPEDPYLYDFSVICGEDRVDSYFALREISIEKRKVLSTEERAFICLNHQPIYLHGLLDQGYYGDGIVLPASPKGYEDDIALIKSMGFNMLRKHIKIEPEVYYYECDRQGVLVMQDLVNSGKYSFLKDTALPTLGKTKLKEHKASKLRKEQFESDMEETIELLKSHPCVFGFTLFNEGWGQYDSDRLYRKAKMLVNDQIIDTASGWFEGHDSDVISRHIYFKKLEMEASEEKPLTLSEYGGYSQRVEGHVFDPKKEWGYKKFETKEALTEGLKSLLEEELIPQITNSSLNLSVLTQVSDVEDETNGLITYDRQIVKVEPEVLQEISKKIYEAFSKQF